MSLTNTALPTNVSDWAIKHSVSPKVLNEAYSGRSKQCFVDPLWVTDLDGQVIGQFFEDEEAEETRFLGVSPAAPLPVCSIRVDGEHVHSQTCAEATRREETPDPDDLAVTLLTQSTKNEEPRLHALLTMPQDRLAKLLAMWSTDDIHECLRDLGRFRAEVEYEFHLRQHMSGWEHSEDSEDEED